MDVVQGHRDWLSGAVAVLGPLAVYAQTAPRNVVLEDDGLFVLAGAHLGVAHPPGYPLYTWIVYLFTRFPFGEPAYLAHLASAVPGAFACGLVYVCARLFRCAPLPALTAALLFGVSEHFWSQAIVAEVYTLNALFVFAIYALLLYGARRPETKRLWPALALVSGLSLANSWPLMLLAAPGLALAAWPARKVLAARFPALSAIGLAGAAVPYAWMATRSRQDPDISFLGPLDGWDGLWTFISRAGYAGDDAAAGADWGDRAKFLHWFGEEMLWQLTLPGALLALCGLWVLFRQRRTVEVVSGVAVLLSQSVGLLAATAWEYSLMRLAVFRPYTAVCFGVAAIWLAVGMQFWLDRLALPRLGTRLRTALAALAGAGMVAWSGYAHWQANDRSGDDFAARYADAVFEQLPDRAVLFVRNEAEIGPLGYRRLVQNRRPDITLRVGEGIVFGNRLYSPALTAERKREAIRRFAENVDRPVLFTNHAAEAWFPAGSGRGLHGLVTEVLRDNEPDTVTLTHHQEWDSYFQDLAARRFRDRASHITQKKLLLEQADYLGYVALAGDPGLLALTEESRALAEQDFWSLLGMAQVLASNPTPEGDALAEAWLTRAEAFDDETIDASIRAHALYLKGAVQLRAGREEAAEASFRASAALRPGADNRAVQALRTLQSQ